MEAPGAEYASSRVERRSRRIEALKAPRGLGVGKWCPLPTGEGSGEGAMPPPKKMFDY